MKRALLFFLFVSLYCATQAQVQAQVIKLDSCDFKDSCSIVKNFSGNGLWQMGVPSKVFFNQATNGGRGLITDTANAYPPNSDEYVDVRFQNPPFNIRFAFWHRFDTDTLADGGYIEVSYDEGQSWQDIRQPDPNNHPIFMDMYGIYGSSSDLGNGKKGFSGRSGDTMLSIIEWVWDMPLKMKPASTWLRFYFYSDSNDNPKEGWMIDRMETSYFDPGGGFDDLANPHRIKAYPNPGNGVYMLEFLTESGSMYELVVYDFQGKEILKQAINGQKQAALDLSEYPSGMYFYTLMEEGKVVYADRLVKE
jgi:hypothetical protein